MLRLPKDNFVLLETNRFDRDNLRSYFFSNPLKVISCYKLEDVKEALFEIERWLSKGFYAAGFISYEAGISFEESLKGLNLNPQFPLLWFGIYKKPSVFSHGEKVNTLPNKRSSYAINNLKPNISRQKYVDNIKRIKGFIRRGDTYQVNYTFKYKFYFSGSVSGFYEDLKTRQSVSYSSIIKTPGFSILSLSPELFFRKNKERMEVRPMKGTIDRGRSAEEDKRNVEALRQSLKNRSENVMIVDLLRNDLGRISEAGSVKTEKLFEVERYETLLQMISVVRARLKRNISIYELLRAIFPSGSVTGAPKISTMKIINSLEREPRRVYTGSIGFFAPTGEAVFNVAIRTVLIDNKSGASEMGIGSGIVIDSDPAAEFEECKLKANFITASHPDFRLIETILWQPKKGYFLLDGHLRRLSLSCRYFDFKFDRKIVMRELKSLEKKFKNSHDYRVRLLLCKDGKTRSSFSRIKTRALSQKVRFSDKKVSSKDIFLYHKTTNRALYDKEHKRWKKKGYFDVIFTNEKNQITEGAISNIIVKKANAYYTPPVECGLLNGVFRRSLFGKIPLKEKMLHKKDILAADEVYMANSVRGMVKVKL